MSLTTQAEPQPDKSMSIEKQTESSRASDPAVGSSALLDGRLRHVQRFEFALCDKVLIRDIQRPGVVEAMLVDSLGPQYRVCYWNESNRKTEWLYASEIELRSAV